VTGELASGAASARDRAELLVQAGRAADAVELLSTHLAANPDDPDALTVLGRAHLAAGNPQRALGAFDAVLTVDPENVVCWQRRSDALRLLGRYGEARDAGRRCVLLSPHHWAAHYTLGLALHKIHTQPGNREELFTAANAAVQLAPDRADPHVLLGLAYGAHGNRFAETQCYERALAIDPQHAYARSNLAAQHLRSGKLSQAMRGFRAAASSNPQEAQFHRNIAATALGSLIRFGYLYAVVVVLVVRLVVASVIWPGNEDGSYSVPVPGLGWPVRLGLAVVVLLGWAVLITIKLRPLSRYLRGHVRQLLVKQLRTGRFAAMSIGCAVSQVCVLAALAEPLSGGWLDLMATLAIASLVCGNLISRLLGRRSF
jgi:tetratricopeptide (TPR) repeat protein